MINELVFHIRSEIRKMGIDGSYYYRRTPSLPCHQMHLINAKCILLSQEVRHKCTLLHYRDFNGPNSQIEGFMALFSVYYYTKSEGDIESASGNKGSME